MSEIQKPGFLSHYENLLSIPAVEKPLSIPTAATLSSIPTAIYCRVSTPSPPSAGFPGKSDSPLSGIYEENPKLHFDRNIL